MLSFSKHHSPRIPLPMAQQALWQMLARRLKTRVRRKLLNPHRGRLALAGCVYGSISPQCYFCRTFCNLSLLLELLMRLARTHGCLFVTGIYRHKARVEKPKRRPLRNRPKLHRQTTLMWLQKTGTQASLVKKTKAIEKSSLYQRVCWCYMYIRHVL